MWGKLIFCVLLAFSCKQTVAKVESGHDEKLHSSASELDDKTKHYRKHLGLKIREQEEVVDEFKKWDKPKRLEMIDITAKTISGVMAQARTVVDKADSKVLREGNWLADDELKVSVSLVVENLVLLLDIGCRFPEATRGSIAKMTGFDKEILWAVELARALKVLDEVQQQKISVFSAAMSYGTEMEDVENQWYEEDLRAVEIDFGGAEEIQIIATKNKEKLPDHNKNKKGPKIVRPEL
ncbi:unnamed protein product, partial [Mesorhabditis spiculigera]